MPNKNNDTVFNKMFDAVLISLRFKNSAEVHFEEGSVGKNGHTTDDNTTDSDSVTSTFDENSIVSLPIVPMAKISIDKLRIGTKPIVYSAENSQKLEKHDLKACHNYLMIIEKVMVAFLDKIPAKDAEELAEYEKNKKNIQQLRTAFAHLLAIPTPHDISGYPSYVAQIASPMQYIKKAMHELELNTHGQKAFLLSRFYLGYLRTLSKTYLFDAQNKLPEQENFYFSHERTDTENRLNLLVQQHIKNPFYNELTPNLLEVFSLINSHEERIRMAKKLKENHKTDENTAQSTEDINAFLSANIQIEKALNQLIIASIDILSHQLNVPEKHLPTSSNKEKNIQLLDKLFLKKPDEYKLLLAKSPETLEKLKESFAFTNPSIKQYFSKPRGIGSPEPDIASVEKLLSILEQTKQQLNQQDEDTYSEVSDPDNDIYDDCFWEKAPSSSKPSEEVKKEAAMPPLSKNELDEKMNDHKPATKKNSFWRINLFKNKSSSQIVPTEESHLRVQA